MRATFKDILDREAEAGRKKLFAKLPAWAAVEGIIVPASLAFEQCSSQRTAEYKAGLAGSAGLIADLTGGLGVDSWAFSRYAGKVIYNEKDPKLVQAARENFARLGASNIEIRCGEAENLEIPEACDLIYLDPARRSATGRKIFLPEDCSPNVIELKDRLLEKAHKVMIKLSPMVDISLLERRFGDCLSEIHVVGADGECKEILCLLRRGHSGECEITVSEASSRLHFRKNSLPSPPLGTVNVGDRLAEPCAALVKAGCAGLVCERYGLFRLDRNTELYAGGSATLPEDFFKTYTVEEKLPFNGKGISETGRRHPKCDVTAKNVPISSDGLRKRMKVISGGNCHVFACTNNGEKIMLVCKK